MHAEDALRVFERGTHGRNGQRGGIAGEDSALVHNRFHAPECNLFLFDILHNGFYNNGAVAKLAHVVGEFQATKQGVGVRICHFSLVYQGFKRGLYVAASSGECDD